MDVEALPRQQVGERVAQRRLAAVAHVQRAGRVGRDELDQHLAMHAALACAVVVALGQHRAQHLGLGGGGQAQVDEAGTGDLHGLDQALRARIGLHRGDDALRQLARVALERARDLHGDVAGKVAVGGRLGPLERDGGQGGIGRGERTHGVGERGGEIGGLNRQHGCRKPCGQVFRRRVNAAPTAAPTCGTSARSGM
ncbi:hypothetical protein D3C81_875500 [compost metagenome]